jgi:hypothetical protein
LPLLFPPSVNPCLFFLWIGQLAIARFSPPFSLARNFARRLATLAGAVALMKRGFRIGEKPLLTVKTFF